MQQRVMLNEKEEGALNQWVAEHCICGGGDRQLSFRMYGHGCNGG